MARKTDTIEVDQATAEALRTRAAERGVSVAEFLAEVASAPVASSAADIAELDRRWAKIEAGDSTVSHDEVVRWLGTWGTPAFKPWRER